MSSDWRPIIAALANDDARRVFALAALGEPVEPALDALSPSRARHVVAALTKAGLLVEASDGLVADASAFTRAFANAPREAKPQGVERYFAADGSIDRYPANKAERGELLALIASRVLSPGEVVSEVELNERLLPFSADTAVLRRYLVDYALVERTRSGSEYALATPE